ncbi:MAG TPA: sigma-70 family RNA polymerase sigma factor [Terriglobia bacterium]|nr:sigma-70 family RNA polymerase sigma factor [Terriglobia bacterium]
MEDDAERPFPYIASAEKIKDDQRRRALLRAVGETWPRIQVYSDAVLPDTVDRDILLDRVVGGVGAAETRAPVQDYGAYLFKSFVNEARKLLRRSSKLERLDSAALAGQSATSDASSVEKLEAKILSEEALAILDDRTRKICVLWSQGLKPRDIAGAVGMSDWAVRKQLQRGFARMRRFIEYGPESEPGPS